MYLLPNPEFYEKKQGTFTIRSDCRIVFDTSLSGETYRFAKLLQREIADDTGLFVSILRRHDSAPSNCIYITSQDKRNEQSYDLFVEEDHIVIRGADDSGILYGIQTLRQIIRQSGAVLPALYLSDAPSVLCRGYYFDTSRGRVPLWNI